MEEQERLCAMTLAQVGAQLGLSRSAVQMIERRALRKVRCALALEKRLGGGARAVLERLRGKPARRYEEALLEAAEAARGDGASVGAGP